MYEISKLDNFGRGICYVDGVITFVYNALPNEIVKIRIINKTKKYNEAIVDSYIKTSEERINPICPYFGICGGCDLMHMSYLDELKFKENKVKDIMYKYAHIDKSKIKDIVFSNELNYRNKATFKVDKKLGFYKKKSNEVLEIDKCLLVDDKINEIIPKLNNSDFKSHEVLVKVGDNVLVNYIDLNKTVIYNNDKIVNGDKIISEIGNYKFYNSSYSFFQVNKYSTKKLYDLVLKYVGSSNNLLDLYCGTGTISIYLSCIAKKVLGVEVNKKAIENALENKKLNNIDNVDFMCLDADKFKIENNYDTIVVDPPRSGLGKNIIKDLISSNALKIVYVSCDILTLARDLKILSEKYEVKEITPVDMFPRTYHVENVVLLEIK